MGIGIAIFCGEMCITAHVLFLRIVSCVEKYFSCYKIPDHYDGGGANLGNKIMDVAYFNACPHAYVVNYKPYDTQHYKNDELAAAAHAFFVGKYIAHGGNVVKHYRSGK